MFYLYTVTHLNAFDFHTEYLEFLNDVKDNLQSQLKRQNRKATGNAINSLRVVANQKLKAELRGAPYLKFLETGVGSKPRGIGRAFIDRIIEWVIAKSIQPKEKQTIKQVAFAIGKSIVNEGTQIYQGQKGISISQAIKESKPTLLKEMGQKMMIDFKNGLKVKKR